MKDKILLIVMIVLFASVLLVTIIKGPILLGCSSMPDDTGVPLLTIPKSEWPQKAIDAMDAGMLWGQCKECGRIVTWSDMGNGAIYTTGNGEITGFYCNKEN